MKIKYNRRVLPYVFLITVIFIIETHFFGLISLPSSIDFIVYKNRSKWIAPLAFFMAVVCWKNYGNGALRPYHGFLRKYLWVVCISIFILYLDATIRYPLNNLITTYGFGTYYLYAFLAVPLLYVFEQENGFENFLKIVNVITAIMYIICILQGIYYIKTGNLLFSMGIDEFRIGVMTRNGKIRMDAGAFANIMLIYNVYNLYNLHRNNRKGSKLSILIIILGLLNVYFTGQTRLVLLSIIGSVAVLFFTGDESKFKKILAGLILVSIATGLVASGIPSKFINSFSSTGDYGGSTIARVNAWSYYFGQFLKNPFSAIGFAGDENYYNIVHGNSGIYYQTVMVKYDYSDCGFIGQLAKTGIFIIFIFLWPLFHYTRISWIFMKRHIIKPGALLVALSCYLIMTSITLIIIDPGRVAAWPLLIAIFEYSLVHIEESKRE